MTMQTTPHLNFCGDARAALEFYRSVFGGHAVIYTYAEFGMPEEALGRSESFKVNASSDAPLRTAASISSRWVWRARFTNLASRSSSSTKTLLMRFWSRSF